MDIVDKLVRSRRNLDGEIKRVIGMHIALRQLSLFSLDCGCTGLNIATDNLQIDDVQVFEKHLLELLEAEFSHLKINPRCVYTAAMPPDFSQVRGLRAVNFCEKCQKEIGEGKSSPEIFFLSFNKPSSANAETEIMSDIKERRGEIEDFLREHTEFPIQIVEFGIFSMHCGCKGVEVGMRGLEMEDIKKIKEPLSAYLTEIPKRLNLKMDARTKVARASYVNPSLLIGITLRDICESCRETYKNAERKGYHFPL